MRCACFVHNCKTEAVRPEHTHCSADVVGLPRRSLCQGVKSLDDTVVTPQFGCLAQSTPAASNSTLEPTIEVAKKSDYLCQASKHELQTCTRRLSNITDVANMATACRPNTTRSKSKFLIMHTARFTGKHGETLATPSATTPQLGWCTSS